MFSTLVGMFDRVVLKKNTGKAVGMVCRPCQAEGTQSEAACERRVTGVEPSYRERQCVQVQCSECGEEMTLGLLAFHLLTQHGKTMGRRRHWGTTAPGGEPCTYKMDFPTAGGARNCLVEGCRGWAAMRMAVRVHFFTSTSKIP